MRGYKVRFAPGKPNELGSGQVIGFEGPGEPGPRTVGEKAKQKARQHRKSVRAQKRHARNIGRG